jgi:hypothetical protein
MSIETHHFEKLQFVACLLHCFITPNQRVIVYFLRFLLKLYFGEIHRDFVNNVRRKGNPCVKN